MAVARRVARTRVTLALATVSDQVKIEELEAKKCSAKTKPADALGRNKKFSDHGIQEHQMPHFREILAGFCPEIRDKIRDRKRLQLHAHTPIRAVIKYVEAALLNSPLWMGQCMPPMVEIRADG